MWSVKDPIVAERISGVRQLGGTQNPVYLLLGFYSTTHPSDSIVVKYERGVLNSASLARNLTVARSAAPGDPQKVLKQAEVTAMQTWAQAEHQRLAQLGRSVNHLDTFLNELRNSNAQAGAWIKMPYRNFLTVEDAQQ